MNLLAAIIDATIDQEAGRLPAEASDRGQPIRLDLHPALAVLGYYDGVYVVISEMPAGTRLSAGRSNTNGTWSLLPDELENLTIMPPEDGKDEFLLTVSIATPDPDGYDFASMTAQFHVHVAGGTSTVPFNSLKRIEPQQQQQEWPDLVQRAVQLSRTRLQTILGDEDSHRTSEPAPALPVIDPSAALPPDEDAVVWQARQLAAERAEWRAEEEARFARTREQWWADAEELWTSRAAELADRHARELMAAEDRWQTREQERAAVTDALWSARLAAGEVQWRSEESERFAHAFANRNSKLQLERWKRAACWVAFAVTIGSMLVA
ncbi:MAG TPA: hypothetical protein VE914_06965 [Candidatus Angelobacter sp.]|nr:hypothetical protein [Candidatus Angelobacter sp.]